MRKKRGSGDEFYRTPLFKGACTLFSFLFVAAITIYFFFPSYLDLSSLKIGKTGMAASSTGLGCCDAFCDQSVSAQCNGDFFQSMECSGLDSCNVGCCMTSQGYCLSNYLKGNCARMGGNFMTDECSEIMQCLEINESSPNSVTGIRIAPNIDYPGIFNASGVSQQGASSSGSSAIAEYALAEPFAGSIGTFFTIRYFSRESVKPSRVEASVIYQGYNIKAITLYDDGLHGDGRADDLLFANVWDSSSVNMFNGVWPVTVDMNIIYGDGSMKSRKSAAGFTIIGTTRCAPLRRVSMDKDAVNIIFMASDYGNYGGISQFSKDAKKNMDMIARYSPFAENDASINYYIVEKDSSIPSDIAALRLAVAECNLYNPSRDLIIVYNYDEISCRKMSIAGDHIYALSPLISMQEGMFSMQSLMNDACSILVTFNDRAAGYISEAPNPVVTTPQGSEFAPGNVNLSFIITDSKDKEIRFTLHAGGESVSGVAVNGTETSVKLSLENGSYEIYVSATDSDSNTVPSAPVSITVNIPLAQGGSEVQDSEEQAQSDQQAQGDGS